MFGFLFSTGLDAQKRADDGRITFTPLAATGRAAEERIELQTVTVSELTGTRSRAGDRSPVSHAVSGGQGTRLSPLDLPLRQTLRRELPRLFQFHLPPETHLSDVRIQYELRSTRGELDTLDHPEFPHSKIDVILRPMSPIVLDSSVSGMTVQGGVVLELNIQDVTMAGSYQGSLTVLIDHL